MIRPFSLLLGWCCAAALGCSSEPLNGVGAGGNSSGGAGSESAGGSGASASGAGNQGSTLPPLSRPDYPSGPYGHGVGAVVPNLSFLGWRDPVAANYDPNRLEIISLSDFYNPNGTPGMPRIIAINASAVWCTVCRAEYRQFQLTHTYETYHPKGVEMFGVLFQDNNYDPAQPSDLVRWGGVNGFNVTFPLALDPSFKLGQFFASDATPLNLLVDASDMRILKITMGYDASNPEAYWKAIDNWLAK